MKGRKKETVNQSTKKKGEDDMPSILNGKQVPFEDVFNDSVFILMNVSRHPVYENNKRTDDYDGQVYEVCDTTEFQRIKVKILEQMKPVIENDAVQQRKKAGKPVFVEIIGGTVTMYEIRDKNGQPSTIDSLNAEEIKLVDAQL